MKSRTLNLLLLCLTVLTAYAHPSQSNMLKMQQDSIPTDSVYEVVEEMPSFPGGQKAMMAFLAKNIQYPEELQNVRGRIVAQFIVEKDGKLSDIKVIRGLEPYLDQETVYAIHAMPNWIPGKQHGEPVKVRYTIPVTFRPPQNENGQPNVKTVGELMGHIERLGIMSNNDTIIVPQFPGGEEALQAYLKEHVKYPSASKKRKEQGTVIVSFVVMTDGNRRLVKVKEGVSDRLDAEALRVVNDMPKWIPGKKGDTTTNVITSVKIEFKLP